MIRLLAVLSAVTAAAAGLKPFDVARFETLQAQGRTILLQFNAQACAVCPQQVETLRRISEEPGELTPVVLQVAFSPTDDFCQQRGVSAPSTLLMFRGKRLIGRAAGLVTEEDVRAFIQESRLRYRGKPPARSKRTIRPKR
jgi:hypothetical protein